MPVRHGHDHTGSFFQYGDHTGKKYYYKTDMPSERHAARAKAERQAMAVHAHGYHGDVPGAHTSAHYSLHSHKLMNV
jgi:hypothetical protein